ncbi:MAG: coproporphyrinogen III oxidase family protein, partial [Clostridia bacterium]|nr:coproporphyrinogen III oxidase family protein [Clostridia bacterium]
MLSLYIHIPFCRRKCAYCAFHSANGNEAQKEQYLQALLKAIDRADHRPLSTLYFGGGTPALL